MSLANMARDVLGRTAGWMDWRNKLSPNDYAPQEVLAPPGMGLLRGAGSRATTGRVPAPIPPAQSAPQLQSAVQIGGQTFTGPTHFHALEAARGKLGADFDRLLGGAKEGFVSTDGRFLDDHKEISRMLLDQEQ